MSNRRGCTARHDAWRSFRHDALRSVLLAVAALTIVGAGEASARCVAGRLPIDTPISVVFSGGGAKAAWEAGVARALADAGIPITAAAGSSAGALNATMLADGRMDRLESTWRTLTREQVYALRPGAFFAGLLPGWLTALAIGRTESLLDPAPLRTVLESIDLARVRASPVRVLVVATDLARREARVFDNASLTVDALLGATALPGVFPAVALDGATIVDGGLVARAPVLETLARAPARRVLVLVSHATGERGREPTSVRRALEEAFETAMLHQIQRDVELARLKYPDVDVQVLAPSQPLDLRPLDFEPAALARAVDRGRADGDACARGWRGE